MHSKWVESRRGEEGGVDVAVKLVKDMEAGDKWDEFLNEVHIMSVLRHPNLLHFYGICLSPRLGLSLSLSLSLPLPLSLSCQTGHTGGVVCLLIFD